MVRFYQEDLVSYADSTEIAIVVRCWQDENDQNIDDPHLDRFPTLPERGQVGILLFPSGIHLIVKETTLTLLDRSFQVGDYCKKKIYDEMSGVITDVSVKARLQHAINSAEVDWMDAQELVSTIELEIGDYVAYDDWIGQVLEVFDEALIELSSGQIVRLPELGPRLTVGDKGPTILPTEGLQSLVAQYFKGMPQGNETVVAVQHTVYAICWLAINQSLDPEFSQARKRPKRFWCGDDISKLAVVRGRSEACVRLGDKVTTKNSTGLPVSYHGTGSEEKVEVRTFLVSETKTNITVLWQDGTQERLDSTELIPYLNPDEYDCWPGDPVVWKVDGQKRAAVVQSVRDRTAELLLQDQSTELVSMLELDTHGNSFYSDPALGTEFGVHRGDVVFIHRQGTNGHEIPIVPRIGEPERWTREYATLSPDINGWRHEMAELGAAYTARLDSRDFALKCRLKDIVGSEELDWLGEVLNLNLDGSITVIHPGGNISTYPLDKLTLLQDGTDQTESETWTDNEEEENSVEEIEHEPWCMDHQGWQSESDENSDEDDADDPETDKKVDQPGVPAIPGDAEHEKSDPEKLRSTNGTPKGDPSTNDACLPVTTPPQVNSNVEPAEDDEDTHWKRFDIQSSVPPDHAFYGSAFSQPSKAFVGRLNREYRALMNGLPESIIVRTYEDRTDLLRSLIIGPENTPYEDAPFVIDWMLDSNYPQSPPIAHFHSWTSGNGRVNPNLYEEGKVCLSILGTWAGDPTETWNATRSSLLQALVSIQGLVLVKEPWFCEPAYDKLRGTEDGIVNSRLYSEKAYVLSRGFIRRALEIPIGGLEDEIRWLYYSQRRLNKVIGDADDLIEKSKADDTLAMDVNAAVPRLSMGGIITLTRTLQRLQALLPPV